MRKIFTFLFAALMSVGMFATTYTVSFTDINSNVKVVENITLPHTFSCDYTNGNGELDLIIQEFYNEPGGRCSTSSWPWGGNNNEVVVGHDGNNHFVTINAPIVGTSFMSGYYDGINESNFYYTFHINIAAAAPQPAEVTVVFAANNKTVERTVTLPHTFKCSWDNGMDGPDELDIIIHELYNDYYYCNSNMNASGSDQVEVGTEEAPKNDYITIKGVFEGTATVTGDYFDWITGEEGKHNYSITISIKGDETAVDNIQIDKAQSTKLIRNGMLLIERNGKLYNATGAEVK